MQRIYLDHNATTPLRPESKQAIVDAIDNISANPSSIHTSGRRARLLIEESRDEISNLVGLPSREIVFTSGGTEADNLAVFAMAQMTYVKDQVNEAIVSSIEHSAVKSAAQQLEAQGWIIKWLNPDANGFISAQSFAELINENTRWASIHWANNETGVIQPIIEMSEIANKNKMLFHSDAVQALGRTQIDYKKFKGEFISFSSHKIGGPKGIGALWVKNAEAIPARQFGGSQEREIRPGTENIYGIAGFGAAAKACLKNLEAEIAEAKNLRDLFENELLKAIPDAIIHGKSQERLINTSSVLLKNKRADLLLMALDIRGYDLSAGSACSSGSISHSPVIKAMGFSELEAASTLRISFGRYNNDDEVSAFVKDLAEVYNI